MISSDWRSPSRDCHIHACLSTKSLTYYIVFTTVMKSTISERANGDAELYLRLETEPSGIQLQRLVSFLKIGRGAMEKYHRPFENPWMVAHSVTGLPPMPANNSRILWTNIATL